MPLFFGASFFTRFASLSLLVLALSLTNPISAQEGQAIGRVVTTSGSVTARDLNGVLRTLARRSDVFVGDTVITGPNGFAQLRMVDSAQISFKADTEFTFSQYSSDGPGGAPDSALMEMVRGGFRTISGSIGEDNDDTYQVSTQFANIGIRGTTHEAVIDAGSLLTGVYDGGTTISNIQGSLDTGDGANFSYSRTFPNQAPEGLIQQPVQLGLIVLAPALAGNDDGEDGDDGAGGGDGNDEDGDANALAGADNDNTAPPPADNTGPGGFNNINQASVDPTVDPDGTRTLDLNPATNVRTRQDFVTTGVGNVGGVGFLSAEQVETTRQRIGFILSRNLSPGAIFPGNVTSLQPGQGVLLIGNDLNSPRTVSSSPNFIFSGGGSFVDFIDGSLVDANQGGIAYDFEAALWGSSGNQVSLFRDFQDPADVSLFQDPFIVVSIAPAPLASLTGEVVYLSNFDRYLGGSSLGGGFSEFFTAFNVDFSAGLITDGVMEFCIGGDSQCNGANAQFWDFDYTGTVREGYVVARPVSSSGRINGQQASIFGLIEGAFTGNNAQAFVGGFNLLYDPDLDAFLGQQNGTSLPETLVDGVFLLEQERRVSRDEIETLDDDAFLVQEGYARIFLGYGRPTSLSGSGYDNSILFVDSRSRPRIVLRDPAFDVSISRVNQNLSVPVSTFFGVDWERWEGPLLTYTNNLNENQFTDGASNGIQDLAYFARFDDSHMTDIQGRYDQVLGFLGESSTGTQISALEMSFDINFSATTTSSNVSNGRLSLKVGNTEGWLVFFGGSLQNNTIEFDLLASNPNNSTQSSGVYDSSNNLVGTLALTDSNMQGAIVSGRNFEGGESPALLSSFFFRENTTSPNRRRVSGLALVARDDIRFIDVVSTSLLDQNQYFATMQADENNVVGMINIPGFNGTLETVLGLHPTPVKNNLIDIVAVNLEGDPSYDNYLSIYDLNQTFGEIGSNNTFSLQNDNFFLQMAYWSGSSGNFSELTAMNGNNMFSSDTFTGPAFWNNFSPTTFAGNLSGRFSTVLEAFGTIAYKNPGSNVDFFAPINEFSMEFDVDFNTGNIMNGYLLASAQSPNYASDGYTYNWSAAFDGSVSGANAALTLDYANFYKAYLGDSLGSYDAVSSPSGAADIIASFTGDAETPILTGSYLFDYVDSTFVASGAGNFATTGIIDARLTSTELYQMEHHVALVVDGGSNGSISFGRASHPVYDIFGTSPAIAINNRGMQTITTIDLGGGFDEVLTGTSTAATDLGAETEVLENYDYDVALGYWNSSNMTILHNQLDASQMSMQANDIFWANVIPADISAMTGTYTYNSTVDSVGYSSYSDMQTFGLGMSFDIDFGTGAISSGTLDVNSYYDAWNATFTGGTLNGSIVEFTGIVGDFSGYGDSCTDCVNGSIMGVFTEDYYSGPPGFTTGFNLNNGLGDYIQGVGLIESPGGT